MLSVCRPPDNKHGPTMTGGTNGLSRQNKTNDDDDGQINRDQPTEKTTTTTTTVNNTVMHSDGGEEGDDDGDEDDDEEEEDDEDNRPLVIFDSADQPAATTEAMTITVRCDVCDMLFLNPSYLQKHLIEAHGMLQSSFPPTHIKDEEEEADDIQGDDDDDRAQMLQGGHIGRRRRSEEEEEEQMAALLLPPPPPPLPQPPPPLYNGAQHVDMDQQLQTDPTTAFLKAYADSVASLVCIICSSPVSSAEHLYLHMVEQHASDMQQRETTMGSSGGRRRRQVRERLGAGTAAAAAKRASRNTPSASSSSSTTSTCLQQQQQQQQQQNQPTSTETFRCDVCRKYFRSQRYLDAHKKKKHHQQSVMSALLSGIPMTQKMEDSDQQQQQQPMMGAGQEQQQEQLWENLMAQNVFFPQQQQAAAMAAMAMGGYAPLVPNMSCAMCRQMVMLFQSHLLTAHGGQPHAGNIAVAQYGAELAAAAAAFMQQHHGISNLQQLIAANTPPPPVVNGMPTNGGGGGALDLSLKAGGRDDGGASADAFCELCQKYFCNKYFLRTHKFNIHGIGEDVTTIGGKQRTTPSKQGSVDQSPTVSNGCESPDAGPMDISDQQPNTKRLKTAPTDDDEEEEEANLQQQLQQPDLAQKTTDGNAAAAAAAAAAAVSTSLSCNLCVKSFPSFFALIAHRYRDHGSFDSSLAAPYMSLGASARLPPLIPSGHHHHQLLTLGNDDSNESACNVCGQEMGSSHLLRVHKFNAHGVLSMDRAGKSGGGGSKTTGRSGRTPNGGGGGGGVKNFCDVCKKELCNKYFLRTHMLKMHGITN